MSIRDKEKVEQTAFAEERIAEARARYGIGAA